MRYALRATLVVLCLFFSIAVPVFATSFEDGLNALEGGNYKIAMRLLRPLAVAGDARAQFRIGVMYVEGRGVPVDYSEAAGWLLQAADQGNTDAQLDFGQF
jgi:TPR repeat protein